MHQDSSATYSMFFSASCSVRFTLKPYQLIGLNWLLLLHKHELSGILADEMVRQPMEDICEVVFCTVIICKVLSSYPK